MNKFIKILSLLFLLTLPAYSYQAYLFDGSSSSTADKLIAMTIAGIVNRDSARLYLQNVYETWSYNQTDEKWRDIYITRGQVTFTYLSSIQAVINQFKSRIKGAITYDINRVFSNFSGQSFRWQAEQAAMLCALTDRIPATLSYAQQLGLTVSDSVLIEDVFDGDEPIWVTGRLELASHPWNNTSLTEEQRYLTLLNWGVTNILPRCNPSKFYIREITDFTIQQRMFQVNLAGTSSLDLNSMPTARADVLESILTYMQNKNNGKIFHIYGWIRPEPMTQWFAFFGSSFHETLLGNLSWHSSFKIPPRTYSPPAKTYPDSVTVENKYYITFISSEGDASNWVIGLQSGAWLSASRGLVPVSWGINLHLLDLCPFIASYYFDTATQNDGFISVTSPLGYAYPDLWGASVLQDAISQTKSLMNKFGIEDIYAYKHYAGEGIMVYRGKTINNSFDFVKLGNFQKAIKANLTFLFDPKLNSQYPTTNYGCILFDHHGDQSFYGNLSDLNTAATNILNEIKKHQKPGFVLAGYQRFRMDDFNNRTSPGTSDINIPRLIQLINILKADPVVGNSIEVVTSEKFSALLRKYLNWTQQKEETVIPQTITLHQNYPNPFNSQTIIKYDLNKSTPVKLGIYDILGNEIITLEDGNKLPASYSIIWDGKNSSGSYVPSGIYFYKLETDDFIQTRKMILLK